MNEEWIKGEYSRTAAGTSYETQFNRESTMTYRCEETEEVWLKGNLRPVVGLALTTIVAAFVCSAVVIVWDASPLVGWLLAGLLAGTASIVVTLAAIAWRPRLSYRQGMLRVRLSPLVLHEVPLESVECFFLGSSAVDSGRKTAVTRRVGTLVMRIADRSIAWQERPTFTPWGQWKEGAVVFDGRWCEPLSIGVARGLSAKLVDAKRATDGGGGEGPVNAVKSHANDGGQDS